MQFKNFLLGFIFSLNLTQIIYASDINFKERGYIDVRDFGDTWQKFFPSQYPWEYEINLQKKYSGKNSSYNLMHITSFKKKDSFELFFAEKYASTFKAEGEIFASVKNYLDEKFPNGQEVIKECLDKNSSYACRYHIHIHSSEAFYSVILFLKEKNYLSSEVFNELCEIGALPESLKIEKNT